MPLAPRTAADAYAAAAQAFQEGKLEEARGLLAPWVTRAVPDARVHGLMGFVLRRIGDAAGAEQALKTARRLSPREAVYPHALGELFGVMGRSAESETAYREALALEGPYPKPPNLEPRRLAALEGLATALSVQARGQEAVEMLKPLIAAGHRDLKLLFVLAQSLRMLGRNTEALGVFELMVAAHPKNGAARHNLAAGFGDLHMHAEAETAAIAALGLGMNGQATWLVRGRALIGLGRLDEAEAALRTALQRGGGAGDVYRELSQLIWMRTGDLDAAGAAQRAVLRVAPGNNDAAVTLAKLYESAGELTQARAVAELALSAQPSPDAALHLLLSDMALASGDPQAALAHGETAQSLGPAHPGVWARLCDAEMALGRPERAAAIAQDILQTEPNSVVATTRLATAWRLMGDDRYGSLYDYDAYVGAYQIETPPGWPDLASYLKDLAATLTDMHGFKAHPFDQSLRQGSQTSQNLMRSADPTLRAFFAAIDAPIREHMAKIAARPGAHGARNTGAYRLADSWSVFLRPGGYHVSHIHPQGWLSSAFYVEVPTQASDDPKAGWIEFGRPGQPTAPALAAEHALAPIPGRLVLFPSYMWHGTVPFASDERRISIAFDVVPD